MFSTEEEIACFPSTGKACFAL